MVTADSDKPLDIVAFWRSATHIPRMQKVAQKILAIPASQASDERIFSATGHTLNARRTELGPDTLSLLTYIHKNFR